MSAADLMVVLLARHLRYARQHPDDPRNDHLIFSKGHASPLLGGRGHRLARAVLPYGVGIALAGKRLDDLPYQVWVLCGDGELAEGSIWEALDKAALPRRLRRRRDVPGRQVQAVAHHAARPSHADGRGVTVHHCLQAADQLAADGINTSVLDMYSVKPVDTAALAQAAEQGGLGRSVLEALADSPCRPRVVQRRKDLAPHTHDAFEAFSRAVFADGALPEQTKQPSPSKTRQVGGSSMTHRLDIHAVDPKAHQAVYALERYVRESGLDPRLYELVKIRASQLNGCAFCLDMHNRDARKAGEDQRRLDVLSAWREAPELFTDAEHAAFALTEAVTRIGDAGVPDPVWDDVAAQFDQTGIVHLLMAIATINVWNRLAVATHQHLPDTS